MTEVEKYLQRLLVEQEKADEKERQREREFEKYLRQLMEEQQSECLSGTSGLRRNRVFRRSTVRNEMRTGGVRCTVCQAPLDLEDPETCYERNPATMRQGWMHGWCGREAAELLKTEDPDKYDRWVNSD